MYWRYWQRVICRQHNIILFQLKYRSYKVENKELETVTKWFDVKCCFHIHIEE